jgi:hypothetical protein
VCPVFIQGHERLALVSSIRNVSESQKLLETSALGHLQKKKNETTHQMDMPPLTITNAIPLGVVPTPSA